eukprot:GHVL01020990.1.p1 GENE.GHVL01020990.1~~GHVL01020990.1.p1  ORF type:complete len:166 (-),score=12.63 GHVL01020990.1:1303-1800(-)
MNNFPCFRRLNKEYSDQLRNPVEGVSAGPRLGDKIFPNWDGYIHGPENSPYEGGVFKLRIVFPLDYPFKPPKVSFVTKITHCNIARDGYLSMKILREGWAPALTVRRVLLCVRSLLDDPNPDDPLVPDIAALLKKNPDEYYRQVREAVLKYATPQHDSDSESDGT